MDVRQPRPWALVLSAAGVVYGAIGVFRLGVGIDAVLVAGALWVAIATIRGSFFPKRENDSRRQACAMSIAAPSTTR